MCYSNIVRKTHRFWDVRLQKCRDLQNRVRGPSRSLEMSPFDRACVTFYWRSIVTMALPRVVSEIFNVEKCRDLEVQVRGHSRSLKVIPLDRMDSFLLVLYSNFVLKTHRFEIFDLLLYSDLETRVTGHSRSLEPTRIDPPPIIS